LKCRRDQFSNRDRAETQVDPEIARALDGREIAGLVVPVHALEKILEQSLRTAAAGRNLEFMKIGWLESDGA